MVQSSGYTHLFTCNLGTILLELGFWQSLESLVRRQVFARTSGHDYPDAMKACRGVAEKDSDVVTRGELCRKVCGTGHLRSLTWRHRYLL